MKFDKLKGGMYMKKITSLFVMAFLLVGTLGFVVAEESVVPEAKKIGFFEDRMDRIRLAFTFNKETKIERALVMAEKRLAEAEVLIDEDSEAYDRVQARYNELVAKAEEILEGIESGAEDENSSVENMEKIARIQNRFEKHRDQADEIYTRARERFEENNASEEKLARFEGFHERAFNRSYVMEEHIIEKKDNAVLKHKVLSEMGDEELEELLEEIESGEGLTEAREVRMENFEDRTDRLEDKGIEITERIRTRLESANLGEDQRARLNIRIESAEGRLEDVGNRTQEGLDEFEEDAGQMVEGMRNVVENELAGRLA